MTSRCDIREGLTPNFGSFNEEAVMSNGCSGPILDLMNPRSMDYRVSSPKAG